jgi:hypothetical protein
MKGIGFVVAVIVVLAVFGLPITGCIAGLLAIGLGVVADVAVPLAMFLAVVLVVGIGVKVWFIDE